MSDARRDAATTSHVFYRKLDHALPRIVRGEGCWLFDADGNRYLDGSGGAMVANVGHGVREIAAAIGAQAATLAYVNGTIFTNDPVEALADALAAKAPPGIDRAYFLSSGSEAVEAALKLARQFHVERGESDRRVIIARTPGYHGNTMLALSASARAHYKKFYGPWLVDVRMIGAPYPYRAGALGDGAPEMSGDALEMAIREAGPTNVAAFIAEPVGGSSTGASVPPAGYYARVRDICDRHGVLFIADEVLCGAGRTGKFFALEHFRASDGGPVVPDMIAMGKGLNGGYAPLSALLVRSSIVETIRSGSGNFQHAQTYSHHPLAASAALATLRYLDEHRLVDRARTMGAVLQQKLRAGLRDAAIVGDVRGIGMLAAVEFVEDKASRRPFPRAAKVAEAVVASALAHGLVVWPNVGNANGTDGDLVMVAPPFVIEEHEIDELVSRLAASLDDVADAIPKTYVAVDL